jgi:twitching motility two-component system response regulator PilH
MTIQKILLVDDSKTELYHLSEILRRHGYAIRTAENGDEALRRLEEDKPDLIVMDVVMPGANGFQATRELARDPDTAAIPVVVCSTKSQGVDRLWALRQGARDYLIKPVDPDALLACVASLVG